MSESLHKSKYVEAKREIKSDDVALFGDDIFHKSEDVELTESDRKTR